MTTATASKKKNAYEVRLITKGQEYDYETKTYSDEETIVLGYVNSVSERGAHTIAARTLDGYPWNGRGVRLVNLTEQARRDAQQREREATRDATRAASGLTEEEIEALAAEYWAHDTDTLQRKLALVDRAISDASQRLSWDRLDDNAPEVAELWHSLAREAEALRVTVAAEYRAALAEADKLELRAIETGAIYESERLWYTAGGRVARFDNAEAERVEEAGK